MGIYASDLFDLGLVLNTPSAASQLTGGLRQNGAFLWRSGSATVSRPFEERGILRLLPG